MAATINVRTRKRLWLRSGGRCAFEGCDEPLLEPIDGVDEDTIVGVECHIVAQRDSPTVARSESSLTSDERTRFERLVSDRHGYSNLVLMCAKHAVVIDDPKAGFTVARIVAMKTAHDAAMDRLRTSAGRRADDLVLRQAAIIDEWESRVQLDEWRRWVGPVFGDGHPRMRREDFDQLTRTREWMFSRVWPGTEPVLEQAFENFRHVAQDLQRTLEQYPHERLEGGGWVAPQRFYNDASWVSYVKDHDRLDRMYEWYAHFLEDLALELTRAANLVCEAVRQTIDPRYRLREGIVLLESGPYGDFSMRLHRPRYALAEGWSPFRGLRTFALDRGTRDEHRDSGLPPEPLRLPGDSLL